MNANEDRDEAIVEQAARWHVASSGDDMDWDGFTRWLETDPRHRVRYEEIALTDALLGDHAEGLHVPEAAASPARPVRWPWAMAAVAAGFAALLIVPTWLRAPETIYTTGAADRTLALADGSTVTLAPHSKLVVSGRDGSDLRLTGGGYFDIRHDPRRQLAVIAGPLKVTDIGTRFDVQANGDLVRIAVAEGEVKATSTMLTQPITLTGGRALLFDAGQGRAELAAADRGRMGAWRQGRLNYENMPLALVAADLGRYADVNLDVPAELRDRRFSGTLVIRDASTAPRDLARIMGLALVRGPRGAMLSATAR